jgi:DNA-directed RNA polymerase subunit omega
MDKREKVALTNEILAKKFKNNFDLVNYAIQLAENMIITGRDARVKSDIQNRAMLVLEEINEGKDQFDQIVDAPRDQNGQRFAEEEQIFKSRLVVDEKDFPSRNRVALPDDE